MNSFWRVASPKQNPRLKATNNGTLIIAEAGVNHNGDLATAYELIDIAAEAGADAVKFQTFNPEDLVTSIAPMASYQASNLGKRRSQLDMLKGLRLQKDDHYRLLEHCQRREIQFLSTPFDLRSIAFLQTMNLPMVKVPSGELTNLPYLRRIAKMGTPVVLSTGMASLEEVAEGLNVLVDGKVPPSDISVLHCTTQYPTPVSDVNLRVIATLKQTFPKIRVGYSDHTLGIVIPIAAVACGAQVIEKHYTLSRSMEGPDHAASLEPNELKAMVEGIRDVEIAMGSSTKSPTPCEMENINVVRKSIVAARSIRNGHIIEAADLAVKRPGTGISPMLWDKIVGSRASRKYDPDEQIE